MIWNTNEIEITTTVRVRSFSPFATEELSRYGAPAGRASVPDMPEADLGDAQSSYAAGNPIFDLLGGSAHWEAEERDVPTLRGHDEPERDPVMNALYGQYCEALSSPLTATRRDWVESESVWEPVTPEVADQAGGPVPEHAPVSALLQEIHTVDQAFGLLFDAEPMESDDDMPEILELFAPPEHHAAAAFRGSNGSPPPELARREHHTLSIDSPI